MHILSTIPKNMSTMVCYLSKGVFLGIRWLIQNRHVSCKIRMGMTMMSTGISEVLKRAFKNIRNILNNVVQ